MWYKETIIYELHVRSFADGDGDGVGDFKGLIGKLDYLQRLGAGAVWLLPFYPSPLRDDGYDIADYDSINPVYGTLRDFRRFLHEAHARGLKVITELVLNHTSDQHAWFQRARRAAPGSRQRDWYVWSDTTEKYRGARIIFNDFEHSNWTWDPVAKAHYWHRFYSHQPDLNYDNPAVRKAMIKVVDHWLGMGVDGLRLDAVPYLIERSGTNCENLPETHEFLKELRSHVDARHPGCMLLAEANQWPEDAVSYFGRGDECHMAFHFPVMPRIFMSLWTEDRYPVVDILEQTPPIPEVCQWALFLRNHDELTLEMVTDEERDYMVRAYASDARARINMGIRRRLAPLMQNNRRRIEVINFLLFSFPGTPIIYYGDELGMGDNYHLGDRHGVRTPMQWSPDRNAGFSTANPQSIYPPVVVDPEYHYQVVNVETQERNQTSLLWWMRRLIAMYKSLPSLGKGSLRFVRSENTKVLSFLREHESQRLLVLVNLSRHAQVAELELGELAGTTPVEVFGGSRFPQVGKAPYVVTLGPHDHFWLVLEDQRAPACAPEGVVLRGLQDDASEVPGYDIIARVVSRFPQLLTQPALQQEGAPQRPARLLDHLVLGHGDDAPVLALVDAGAGQEPAAFCLAMPGFKHGESLRHLEETRPEAVLARLKDGARVTGLIDGLEDARTAHLLAAQMTGGFTRRSRESEWSAKVLLPRARRAELAVASEACRLLRSTRHSACWSLGNEGLLKIYRHPEEGAHHEPELLKALKRQGFEGVPELIAELDYRRPGSQGMTLAVIVEFLPGAENGRDFADQALRHMAELALATDCPVGDPVAQPLLAAPALTQAQRGVLGEHVLDFFRRLGERAASLHAALGREPGAAFEPEPFNKLYQRSIYQSMRNLAHRADSAVRRAAQEAGRTARRLPLAQVRDRLAGLLAIPPSGLRIRIHGDFRLVNILRRGPELCIVDFDGDVRLPLGERAIKRSPLRDVANMLVSIERAVSRASRSDPGQHPADQTRLAAWRALWRRAAGHAFLKSYLEHAEPSGQLPGAREETLGLLRIFLLEQLLGRVMREAWERPDEADMYMDMVDSYLKVFP
ncbi:Trehalose synthase/amylase TreS [Fundidesulfovibrio magnetotacticus]|uniref:maltose alpha-D-glucosyltransferase n=1 Tax=Fundidesulfovibrio magnetotacticus TaxID=2730080 RepID=A0A6V8LIK4_9BACT|nr:maltose alpha-D-glucosyltransferase [Fundidesulfovibrio magnetotacticus]GFK92572.1 Trehalose synthase/amylase TreS [Fundidesulfovibrio magnetotacticus]